MISVTWHTSSGQVGEVQRSSTSNGVTTAESFLYTDVATGTNAGLVQNVTLRCQGGSGGWSTIRQAVFTYYDVNQANGNPGDLETEPIEDASSNVLDTSYSRNYRPGPGTPGPSMSSRSHSRTWLSFAAAASVRPSAEKAT